MRRVSGIAAMCWLMVVATAAGAGSAAAQAPASLRPLRGAVVDTSGAAIAGATIVVAGAAGTVTVQADADGSFVAEVAAGDVIVVTASAPGFAEVTVTVKADGTPPTVVRLILQPATFAESVSVTASRGAALSGDPASVSVVTSAQLANSPFGAVDDALRGTPGFSLFRRSSSRVANSTTQGVTLRGVSGSGASRTLVLADGVPLNDPFGTWTDPPQSPVRRRLSRHHPRLGVRRRSGSRPNNVYMYQTESGPGGCP